MTRTKSLSAALLLVALACKKEEQNSTATYTPPPTATELQTSTVPPTETFAGGPLAMPPDGPVATTATPGPGSKANVALTPEFTSPPGVDAKQAQRIPVEAVQQQMNAGDVLLVDVRDAESYHTAHASGAVNIPFHELAQRMGELPKDKYLVTYCT